MDIKPDIQEFLRHHGIKGQKWGVRHGPPYPLSAETKSHMDKPPIQEVLEKSQNRDTIVQDAISSGEVSKTVNREKQMRHTLDGHSEGRSYLYGDLDYAQELVDELSGTGQPIMSLKGQWTHQERVESSETVGTHVDSETGVETQTNKAIITYSKTGSHIYPGKDK